MILLRFGKLLQPSTFVSYDWFIITHTIYKWLVWELKYHLETFFSLFPILSLTHFSTSLVASSLTKTISWKFNNLLRINSSLYYVIHWLGDITKVFTWYDTKCEEEQNRNEFKAILRDSRRFEEWKWKHIKIKNEESIKIFSHLTRF